MTKRMLIDATHAEETRVVVLDGNRLEDFDVETSTKRQLKGNIYLAKVVRVEPSLQACFVEYGGNRHGFLAFSEIHPDYYQIPVADRQRLLEQEAEEAQREEEEADREAGLAQPGEPEAAFAPAPEVAAETGDESGVTLEVLETPAPEATEQAAPEPVTEIAPEAAAEAGDESGATAEVLTEAPSTEAWTETPPPPAAEHAPRAAPPPEEPLPGSETAQAAMSPAEPPPPAPAAEAEPPLPAPHPPSQSHLQPVEDPNQPDDDPEPPARRAQPLIIEQDTLSGPVEAGETDAESSAEAVAEAWRAPDDQPAKTGPAEAEDETDLVEEESEFVPETPPPETIGGEPEAEEQRERRMPPRFLRNYKIQEVIRRRQILLVQVVKEERGTKGAALTTYLSLAGRFCVLMPNSPRGGGISRKITSATDRRRLKEIIAELDMPKGMGLIVRTAGANRPKPEIKRDCEYLLRLWDDIREHTLKSVAPALIYEEASLIKRAIRDVYSRDIDEILVDGEDGWRAAHEFMRMLMPTHAKKVQLWRDPSQPLFARYQVEAQLDAMLQPTVQLRSGGYLVINQAEALVAIDVNSGRSTRERNVEETALRTNLEAADEVARQLRLRDLAGLVVIDFIDMESKKHNAMVERRMKEALKNDRARIQVGHISHFGLLEMSRQRLRPSLAETSFILCPHCAGTGHIRSTESAAIHVLRGIEDEGSKRRAAEIVVHVALPTALYILNHKRDRLGDIESRYAMRVTVVGDDTQLGSQYRIDRVRPQVAREGVPAAITPDLAPPPVIAPEVEEAEAAIAEEEAEAEEAVSAETEAEEEQGEAAEAGEERGEGAERRRRRRRRRRGGRREEGAPAAEAPLVTGEPAPEAPEALRTVPEEAVAEEEEAAGPHIEGVPEHAEPSAEEERRRRGRRGGRRRRREGEASPFAAPGAEQPELPPVYVGPTPANPFGDQTFDIFDVLEQAESRAAAARVGPAQPMVQQFEPQPASQAFAPAAEEVQPSSAEAIAAEPVPPAPVAPTELAVPEGSVVAAEPQIVSTAGPEPRAEAVVELVAAESVAPEAGAPSATAGTGAPAEAAQPEAPSEAAPEPAVRPILIGSGEEPAVAEKKRGWWRR